MPAKKKPAPKKTPAKKPASKTARTKKTAAKKTAATKTAANSAPRGTDAALKALRAFGLAYPGAHTKSPWPGHLDLAVKDKTFAYLSIEGEPFQISCKLPRSHELAMMLEGVTPTAYGLGKSGWVTATFPNGELPLDLLKDWIDESYRAQAPKKLVASLPPRTAAPTTAAPR